MLFAVLVVVLRHTKNYFPHCAFYFEVVNRKSRVASCLFTALRLWEGGPGPGRKTLFRKPSDGSTLLFKHLPKTNRSTPVNLTRNGAKNRNGSGGFVSFVLGNKVWKVRGENGELS